MLKRTVFLSLFFTLVINTYAQPWLHSKYNLKSTNSEFSFKEQQEAFNEYFENKDATNAKGQKQFRRWESIMAPRLYNDEYLNSIELWSAIVNKPVNPPYDLSKWEFVGPISTPYKSQTTLKSGNGRLNCVAFHPTDESIIYVGAPSGGLWKTLDGGDTWSTMTDKLAAIGISDIVVSHEDASTIYAVTGDGDYGDTYAIGIIKSIDGGETWETTSLSLEVTEGIYFRRIIMNPNDADIMLATASNGIYKTEDGWDTYTKVISGAFKDIEYKPSTPTYVYATSYGSNNSRIYRSTDSGDNFSTLSSGLSLSGSNRIELAVSEANSGYLYALASNSSDNGFHSIHKSTNSGDSWTLMFDDSLENLLGWELTGNDFGGQGSYDLALAVSPTDINTVFVGGVNIWKSENGGESWDINTMWYHNSAVDYVHADQHMLVYSPLNDALYVANDGGAYKSTDDGAEWDDISNDLQILQSYHIGISQLSEGKIISGNQDNGTFLYSQDEWFEVISGDGMQCHIDPTNDDIIYGSIYYGDIYKSEDGGLNFSLISPSEAGDGNWITPYILHPLNPDVLYAGYTNVYKSSDRGVSWTAISDNLSTTTLNELAVAHSNDDYIYASSGSTLHKTTDGGSNWTTISSGLPANYISSICISPNDQNELWVSLSGYSDNNKVYYSNDGGLNWENYSDGLPNIPTNDLIFRENSNKELYLATDIGVYYRHADTNSWVDFSNDLPNVIVSDLEIAESFNKLRAGTYGRGVWETDIDEALESIGAFTSNILKSCINAEVQLTYTGSYSYDSLNWDVDGGEIISQNTNKDTITVTYSETGNKTIELLHYRNDTLTRETNYNYLEVSSKISFSVSPSEVYTCDDSEIEIYLPSGYDYSVSPNFGVVSLADNFLILAPSTDTLYTITAEHGTCTAEQELPVAIMADKACDALLIPEGVSGLFSNTCASSEEGEAAAPVGTGESSGCISQDGWCDGEDLVRNTVWFKISVPENGQLAVTVDGFDSKIALYKVTDCSDLLDESYELIAANDDRSGSNYNSYITLISDLTPGDMLYLQVDGSYGGELGQFTINVMNDITSVDEISADEISNIKVYPNPADEQFTLRLIVPDKSIVDVKLIAQNGTTVISKPGVNVTSFYEETFNTQNLSGVYFLRITTDERIFFKKVIIR